MALKFTSNSLAKNKILGFGRFASWISIISFLFEWKLLWNHGRCEVFTRSFFCGARGVPVFGMVMSWWMAVTLERASLAAVASLNVWRSISFDQKPALEYSVCFKLFRVRFDLQFFYQKVTFQKSCLLQLLMKDSKLFWWNSLIH